MKRKAGHLDSTPPILQTTHLLNEHLPLMLAQMGESFLIDVRARCPHHLVFAGHYELMMKVLESDDYDDAVYGAGKVGDAELTKLLLSKGADRERALYGACAGGHLQLLQDMVGERPWDVNHGLECAARGGHMHIVEYLLAQGATDYNSGLCAGRVQNRAIVELMISLGAKDWDYGLNWACKGGDRELVQLMLSRGAHVAYGLRGACCGGHVAIVKWMIELGASDWQGGLDFACTKGHVETATMMVARGATGLDSGFGFACQRGHIDVMQYLMSVGAKECWSCGESMAVHQQVVDGVVAWHGGSDFRKRFKPLNNFGSNKIVS